MSVFDAWKGTIEVNGTHVESLDFNNLNVSGGVTIHLMPEGYVKPVVARSQEGHSIDSSVYKIKVRAWMTKGDFDFMVKWNNNVPMPLRVMVGTVNKSTEKMVNMTLHGDILEEITQTCMCCGKPITNEVSKYFGMGPVCGQHNYVNPFSSKEELKQAVADYRVKLQSITWTGWIPKSAIEEIERLQ